jgi:hypothetical protein
MHQITLYACGTGEQHGDSGRQFMNRAVHDSVVFSQSFINKVMEGAYVIIKKYV